MPLQATSGAASYDGFGGGVAAVPNYIEDVFSTYLYTGNASTQTITNNIDFSTYGGLAWIKRRDQAGDNQLFDTVRGATKYLVSNSTAGQATGATKLTSFTTSGYVLGADGNINGFGDTYTSWSFRKQAKFFDVVTYTGNGANRDIAHNLGSTPAVIFVKQISSVQPWAVYHRSLSSGDYLLLNTTAAVVNDSTYFTTTAPTSTTFRVGTANATNANTQTYVAYLFAHNAGGFGLTGTDNVISCGSLTMDGSGNPASVTLGYEPQLVIAKRTDAVGAWYIEDNMRGMPVTGNGAQLYPNTSGAEAAQNIAYPNATGFTWNIGIPSATYIYIAIRRGPMKVPTSGTSVFTPVAWSGTGSSTTVTGSGFAADAAMIMVRNGADDKKLAPRLTGQSHLTTDTTNAEITSDLDSNPWSSMNGINVGSTGGANQSGKTYGYEFFKRAPSFMDVVCYTGTGVARTITHNLGVVPELMIVKPRSLAGENWIVYNSSLNTPAQNRLVLNGTFGQLTTPNATWWNSTNPTASVFSVGTPVGVNGSGYTYVAYLFASCAGVSKVGSYTGNGSSQTINCGFTGGSRFVLIKRTDSTGDWYVWDTARGIVTANDPHLSLNTTAAEVTTDDTIDTDSTGFIVNQVAATNVNVTSATYIFLAIA